MVPADEQNRFGYFEDIEIVRLHQEMLQRAAATGRGGHADWGWTEDEVLDRSIFSEYRGRAQELIARRSTRAGWWGFKDPRTTVALDLWEDCLDGEACYLFVYRFPWQVADSMQRLGADVFLRSPEYAYRIWTYYNRRLLEFVRRNRERCLLVSTNELAEEPRALASLLQDRFGVEADPKRLEGVVRDGVLGTSGFDDPIAQWTLDAYPEVRDLLLRLDDAADLPNRGRVSTPGYVATETGDEVQVSVIIPCLNHGELLLDAIASVERSLDLSYEVLIVDDGSTAAETHRILDRLRASGYRVIAQEQAGLAAARNRGIGLSRAPYILALDADNRIRSGFVEAAVEILDRSASVGVVYGDRMEFGKRRGRVTVGDFDLPRILWQNYIDACAVFRREAWQDVDGYDELLEVYEDWGFWISLAQSGWEFSYLPVVAFDYRVRPGSLVTLGDDPEVNRRVKDRVLERHRDLYAAHALDVLRTSWSIQR